VFCYAPPLRFFLSVYADLTVSLRRFNSECYIAITEPSLMIKFTRANHTCTIFCTQANNVIQGVRPAKTSLVTSSLIRTTEALIFEWTELIEAFNFVETQELTPHFQMCAQQLDILTTQLNSIATVLETGTLQSHVSRSFFEKVQRDARTLRHEAGGPFSAAFNFPNFIQRIKALSQAIQEIFQRAVQWCNMSTSEIMRLRSTTTTTTGELVRLCNAFSQFQSLSTEVRDNLRVATERLDVLCSYLGLPLGVKIDTPIRRVDNDDIEWVLEDE
jgi:hypothetical protein